MLTAADQKRMESLKALFNWHWSEINSERNCQIIFWIAMSLRSSQ